MWLLRLIRDFNWSGYISVPALVLGLAFLAASTGGLPGNPGPEEQKAGIFGGLCLAVAVLTFCFDLPRERREEKARLMDMWGPGTEYYAAYRQDLRTQACSLCNQKPRRQCKRPCPGRVTRT